MPGMSQDMQQTMSAVHRYEVVEVDSDGATTMQVTYESLTVTGTGPLGPIEYDSANPPATLPPYLRSFEVLAGHQFTMTFGPDGGLLAVSGTDELRDRMLAELNMPAGAMGDSILESVKDRIGDDGFVEAMSSMHGIFPAHAVAVGDSWTKSSEMSAFVPMAFETTWSLESRRDGVAHLAILGTVEPGLDPTMQMGPVTMRYDLTGEQSGVAEIDEATGWLLRMRMESKFDGSMRLEGMPAGASNTEIPVSSRNIISIEPIMNDAG